MATPENTPSSQTLTAWRSWCLCWWWIGVGVVWLAVVVNWTIRDSIPLLAIIFYAGPPVVTGTFALLLAWFGRRICTGGVLWMNRSMALLGVLCLAQWVFGNFRLGVSAASDTKPLKLIFWNVGHGHFASWDQIIEQIRLQNADVIALVEAAGKPVQTTEFWERKLPNYTPLPLRSGMVVLVKGRVAQTAVGLFEKRGSYRQLSLEVRSTEFNLILADIDSNPLRSREKPLRELFELMRKQSSIPTLVVGDLNTPPTSVWFDRWRSESEWSRAWEVAGSGYQATWPIPLPVLTPDQVWGNREVTFHRCVVGWSCCSDHRPVIVDMSIGRRSGK